MSTDIHTQNLLLGLFIKHPIVGAITSLTFAILGRVAPLMIEVQVPIIWMQIIQICVWTIGGIAGILTIVGFFKKKQ